MPTLEYKVVPAPKRGTKARGVKATEDRFALALEDVMNAMATDGWEYQRTDTLPCEERVGLTGRTTVFQNMLVFRRAVTATEESLAPRLISPPAPVIAAPPVATPETPAVRAPTPAHVTADTIPADDAATESRVAAE